MRKVGITLFWKKLSPDPVCDFDRIPYIYQ